MSSRPPTLPQSACARATDVGRHVRPFTTDIRTLLGSAAGFGVAAIVRPWVTTLRDRVDQLRAQRPTAGLSIETISTATSYNAQHRYRYSTRWLAQNSWNALNSCCFQFG
jgi:hypothetical protein